MTPSERLFRLVVRTWPKGFRGPYAESMCETFLLRKSVADRGPLVRRVGFVVRELASAAWISLTLRGSQLGEVRPPKWTGLDVRAGVRGLTRRPTFTLLVTATLAVGVGLNVAAFAVVNAVVLEPLPYAEPDRLVGLWSTRDGEPTPGGNVSRLDLSDLERALESVTHIAGYQSARAVPVRLGDRPSFLTGVTFTEAFFGTLGLPPLLGRMPTAEEFGRGDVVLLGHGAWLDGFGGDPGVVGRAVTVDESPRTVIGIMGPDAAFFPAADVDLWMPYVLGGQSRGSRNLRAVARLEAGLGIDELQQELDVLTAGLAATYPESNAGRGVHARPLGDLVVGREARRATLLLIAVTGTLLVLTVANVANLFFARSIERRGDVGLRVALGASSARALSPAMVEACAVGLVGASFGLLVAWWLPGAVIARVPAAVPRATEVAVDGEVALFAIAAGLGSALFGALLPGWLVARRSALTGTRRSNRRTRALTTGRWQELLTVAQVAGALSLLSAAGLLLRSFDALTSVQPGFAAEAVLTTHLHLPRQRYATATEILEFQSRLFEAVGLQPGIEGVAAVSMVPFGGGNLCDDARAIDGETPDDTCIEYRSSTPGYFRTLGIPLIGGRGFRSDDDREGDRVAILNRAAARLLFGAGDPVGRSFEGRGEQWTVIGIAEDARHFSLDRPPVPEIHLPFAQAPMRFMNLVARAAGRSAEASNSVRGGIALSDRLLAVPEVTWMSELVSTSVARERVRTATMTAMSCLALVIALLGIGGLLSFLVRSRRREIGIRMAVGGSARDVSRLFVAYALRLTGVGIVVGLPMIVAVGRGVRSMLYETAPLDAGVAAGATLLLVATSCGTAIWATRAATRVEPREALRGE